MGGAEGPDRPGSEAVVAARPTTAHGHTRNLAQSNLRSCAFGLSMRDALNVDFVISNPRHHLDMSLPVIQSLREEARVRCRLLSLCELRGMDSPRIEPQIHGAELRRLVPRLLRRPKAVDGVLQDPGRKASSSRLRDWTWRLVLAPAIRGCLREGINLVVLPNDAAYPYDRLAALLRRRGVPFLLLQEGIRFPLPAEAEDEAVVYGSGGASGIAAWGKTSAKRFREVGVAAEQIHLVGNPRFDDLRREDWSEAAAEIRRRHGLDGRNLLLLTNPIDAQGFCSKEEKLALVARFASSLMPLLETGLRLVIKTHGGEDPEDYRRALDSKARARVLFLPEEPLYGLFRVAGSAVILASTVGLEAQLFDLPLGVLEIPGSGFVHDYVDSGAALGLSWSQPMVSQVEELLGSWATKSQGAVEDYLAASLTQREGASQRVARLILELLEKRS